MVLVLRLGCQRCGGDSGACKRILSEVGRRYDVIRAGLPAVIAVDITPTIVDGERTCPGHRRCQPRAAVELAADGWRYVPEIGTARIRLASIEARVHARLRDQRAAENALARAEQARDEGPGCG